MSKIQQFAEFVQEHTLQTKDVVDNEYRVSVRYVGGDINRHILCIELDDDEIYLDEDKIRELRDFLSKFL